MKFSNIIYYLLVVSLFLFPDAKGQEDSTSLDLFLDMSLEELMDIEITSVSKKSERIQDVPSSIYVITANDIERSPAQNLMQLLRDNVPGYWAVENEYKNVDAVMRNTSEGSVLVLLDGTPMQDLMSSSFDYENFDIPLEVIDRIEIIRGSGGTIYGANSATGVISIYTKDTGNAPRFNISGNYATPGKAGLYMIGTPLPYGALKTTVYAGFTHFAGFDQADFTVDPQSMVPKLDGSGDTLILNRFTGDDNTHTSFNGGLNTSFEVSERLTLTAGFHFNGMQNEKYAQFFPVDKAEFLYTGSPEPKIYAGDTVFLKKINKYRSVGHVQADYIFSENHSVFTRLSFNAENTDFISGGGFNARNNIVDFEVQDNFTLGINTLSIGGNYRIVNYNLSDYGPENQVQYTEANNQAALAGAFVQDKISLLEGKLNVFLGVKAENFSLINNTVYFSPMAKIAATPMEDITLWGGYTQSYTTPGYNQTNVEYYIFRAESPEVFYSYAYPQVSYSVYQSVYQQALAGGADESVAEAMAQAYIESQEGMTVIDAQTQDAISGNAQQFPGHYNVAGTNGPNTVPTSFQNYEAGVRFMRLHNLALESNFYYSLMKDGFGNSLSATGVTPSSAFPGENMLTYYYGNYFKGTNTGLETQVRWKTGEKLQLELSHVWQSFTLELQENDEFDISELPAEDLNLKIEEYPQTPEHVFRAKVYYDPTDDLRFTISGVYASAHWIRFGTIEPNYQFQNQRYDPLYSDGGVETFVGGRQDDRTIINFRVDKYFLDHQLNVYIFGQDILTKPFTEGINQIETIYPRQVGRMFGVGLNYSL